MVNSILQIRKRRLRDSKPPLQGSEMGFNPGVQLHPDLLHPPFRDSCVALEKPQRAFTGWAMLGKAWSCPIIGFLICEMGTAILAPPDQVVRIR